MLCNVIAKDRAWIEKWFETDVISFEYVSDSLERSFCRRKIHQINLVRMIMALMRSSYMKHNF